MRLDSPVSLVWPECDKSFAPPVNAVPLQPAGPWELLAPTPVSHLIAIPEAVGDLHFVGGDVIGVFDVEGMCCGWAAYSDGNTVITAFADDETTSEKDGFAEGEEMTLRWYRTKRHEETCLGAFYAEGSGYFTAHGLSVISALETVSGTGEHGYTDLVTVYPTPARDRIFIKGLNGFASYELISQCGRIVSVGNYLQHCGIDITHLNAGLYSIRIIEKGRTVARKVLIN
ncbi:MAG: T9SS type A sorting domain-containing protein [Bacteroidales bacterium]